MAEKLEPTVYPGPAKSPGLALALANAQAEFPDIPRSKTVTVKTQSGSYDFSYAPLDTIIKLTRPILTKNGLAVSQLINKAEGGTVVVTKLMHVNGESIESQTPIVQIGAGSQAFGSALTYIRRYSYCAILCIQAEDDDDANAADGNALAAKGTATLPQKAVAVPAAVAKKVEAATPSQIVTIKSVEEKHGRPKKNPQTGEIVAGATYYEAVFLDGRKASTFNKDHAALLYTFIGEEVPAILVPSRDGQFLNITLPDEFVKANTPPDEPEPPSYDDDGLGGFVPPEVRK